ncbi:SusC/RagA family TonB-linked outer membrane protein [Pedobacter frigidisoli]|uniref:SusC/RagA family TonB-linked outer membrane protein n=1 Tax=Pedobacter frigidisoli TaxID=2530455 RepID=A0A4R0P0C2_9SPHI|nr:SusC/RagA family TonB-linked outer membrane protein [Pedobacter frigidisoli]TCD05636.1 SusC/RagA family TonB-linked outer membrane protein [Pedobacter frigidisoli]
MHNFTIIKKGITLALFCFMFSAATFAQQTDTSQYSTDTTTVKVKQKKLVGQKITGLVVDGYTNKPITGAKLTVVDFSGALTDDKGRFNIVVPDFNATILISNTGYHTKLLPVHKGKLTTIKIYPTNYNSLFTEVVLPSGTQNVARSTSAISSVNPQGGWNVNSESPDGFLQGKLAGVNSIRRSGTPGIGAGLFVRGFTSLYATNQPLYVVDGMVYDANAYGTSLTTGHRNNPLQFIDVRDIESISLIKDAAAAAVYGTKAANGVMVITTNHAKDLATAIDFSAYSGFNLVPRQLPVMNVGDFRTYLSDVLKSQGLSSGAIAALPYMNDNPDPIANPTYQMYHQNTDWQKQVFKSSFDQTYFLKVSGGDNIAKYALSAGYSKDKSVLDSTNNTKYTMRFNSDLNLTKKLTANTNLSFSYTEQRLKDQGLSTRTNPIFLALVKAPFMGVNEISALGAVSPNLAEADTLGVSNPRALIEKGLNQKKAYRFFGNIIFDYQFTKSFKVSNLTGVTYDKTQETLFIPRKGVTNEILPTTIGDSKLGSQVIRYFSVFDDFHFTYNKTIAKNHNLHVALGTRFSQNQSEQDFAIGYNSATDVLISIGNSNAALRYFGGDIGRWSTLNTYLTGDYSYKDKYYLSFALAADASSRFGKRDISSTARYVGGYGLDIAGGKTALLPALSAAWLISSEDFMKNYKGIDLLKFRMSYGLVGNDDIGNYNNRQYYVSQNLLGLQGTVRGNIANPNIQWEQIAKFNTGLDAAFFNERLSFSLDYYVHKTSKMLTYVPVASVGGINSYIDNQGGMTTSGLDFSLNGRITNKTFKWDLGLTLGTYKNDIDKLPNGKDILTSYANGTYLTRVGQTANLFYGQRTNGVYATDAEATASGLSIVNPAGLTVPFKGGDMRFVDTNGDKIINAADRVVIGDPNPDIYGSINNTFGYKNWTLDVLVSFVAGNDIYNYTRSMLESGSTYYNQTDILRNRWRGEGQVTNVPKAAYGDPMGNAQFSDRWIEDGSYLRLRTVNLTYNVPIKAKAIKYAKVYATGNNLFTLTNYLGYDPEFSASGSIFTQGVDTTLEPQFRSVQLGVRIGL